MLVIVGEICIIVQYCIIDSYDYILSVLTTDKRWYSIWWSIYCYWW